MIIAWGLFIPSILSIILAFKDKLDKDIDFNDKEFTKLAITYIVALCSIQYIYTFH